MRRATPDSEALASSEDERPWPPATTIKRPPAKGIVSASDGSVWSSSQSRGSFELCEQARCDAAREARLAALNKGLTRPADVPPSATSRDHGATYLPFVIPLQSTPKAGRSSSHPQRRGEMPPSSSMSIHRAVAETEGPAMLPLGLLNELVEDEDEDDAESDRDPELGGILTQTASHPVFGNVQRTSTLPTQYASPVSASKTARRSDTLDSSCFDRRFETAFGELRPLDQHPRRPQWQKSLVREGFPHCSESRRHSIADLQTRRDMISAGLNRDLSASDAYENNYLAHSQDIRTTNGSDADAVANVLPPMSSTNTNAIQGITLPAGYKLAHVALEPHQRNSSAERAIGKQLAHLRPGKLMYIVSFKCSRVGVFYLLDNSGLVFGEGDMVIVEADRGQDLGIVQHARVTQDEARTLLAKYGEEQYKWLMMFSNNKQAGVVNPNAAVYGESHGSCDASMPSTRPPRDQYSNLKPRVIKRMAAPHEIHMLREKEGNESKAKRACQQKVFQHHLDMEILEAEFQWDWQKLIFYYYADHYINFKNLINDLYKLYKVRLWMSAVNPASFSPNAIHQPPTGIAPGAITSPAVGAGYDTSYTMAYGADPNPCGAVPPYQLPINTYNPKDSGIPGIHNDYSPMHLMQPMLPMARMASVQQMQPMHQARYHQPAKPVQPINPAETVESGEPLKPVAQRAKSDHDTMNYLYRDNMGVDLDDKPGGEEASQQPSSTSTTTTCSHQRPERPLPASLQPPIARPLPLTRPVASHENGDAQESIRGPQQVPVAPQAVKSRVDWVGFGMMHP